MPADMIAALFHFSIIFFVACFICVAGALFSEAFRIITNAQIASRRSGND